MNKITLYGGSFDPIHIGHLIVASNVVDDLKMDELIFIPSNITPLKNSNLKASNLDRYEMIKRSIEGNDKFSVSDYEITKDGISYTYDTVKHFKNKYPNTELYFLVGTDRVKDLEMWHKIKELSEMVTFIFSARDTEQLEKIISQNKFYNSIKYVILKSPVIEISSTTVRKKIKNKQNINYIVTPECANYIKELNLYEF